jgi:hypothetical protein
MHRPLVVLDVSGCSADLALVDVVLRVVLQARRLGADVAVRGMSPPLAGLLRYTGLDAALEGGADGGDSELGRQPEAREQARVEEVVDVVDAPVAQFEHLDRPRQEPPVG